MSRGGKRVGAGRPTGSRWKPATAAFRADAVEKQIAIIGSDTDPLTVVASWVTNPDLDMNFRLSAANTCLPFLFPRLSASQVNQNIAVTKVDAGDLVRKLDEQLARLAQPVTIEAPAAELPLAIETATDDEAGPE